MTEPNVERAGGEPTGSSFSTLISTLIAPEEAFRTLAVRPFVALALIVLLLSGAVALHVSMSKVTAQDFLQTLEESGRQVPPQALENPERLMTISLWSQTVAAAILPAAVYLALAGIFVLALRMLGGEVGFRHSLATTVHGMLPFAVAALLGIAVASFRDTITLEEMRWGGVLASNLGLFAEEGAGKVAQALLTSVDLFSIWCIYLLATGFRIVARVTARAAWTAVICIWLAGVAIKVGMATVF